ncbi:hypothetical protein Bca52824_069712 [Brassica carinata]|uniref:Uncharacterized protein n=1 Tax=Brassica carinata TaxID=52824 RepID=A0A8X7Q483_BRACI|nr:hypothetical protein Bca52824_069712 [Brassica carinata]
MALFLWILVVAVSGAILFMVMTGMLNAVLPKKSQRDVWFEVNNQILNALFTLMCLYQHPKRFHHLVLLCRWKQEDDVTALRKIYCEKELINPTKERPPVGVGICVSVAIASPAVAGIFRKEILVCFERDDESDLEWRGGVLDIWEDIKVSYLSLLCTFCVFGWNMERIGFGNMYVHIATFVLFCLAPFFIFNLAAINIDNEVVREGLGYMGIVLCVFGLLYGGFWRIQMRKRFKLPGYSFCCGRPAVADCTLWLFCCWCSLAQEVRTANAYEIVEDKLCKRREEEVKADEDGVIDPSCLPEKMR